MNFNFNNMLECATKRAKTKRPACRLGYGCRNYFWLKPGTTDVVCVGSSSAIYATLKTGHNACPRRNRLFTYNPLIELHAKHAIVSPKSTPEERMLVPITTQAVAANLGIPVDDIQSIHTCDNGASYTSVNMTLNNILWYLGMNLYHTGSGAHKPGLIWIRRNGGDGTKIHTGGPVRYEYASHAISAEDGELEKKVDEPARLALNKRIREANKRLKAIARMGATYTHEDVLRILERQSFKDSQQAKRYFLKLIEPASILDRLENLDLTNMDSTIELLMAISGSRTARFSTWTMHYIKNPAPNDDTTLRVAAACNIHWANDPQSFESTPMAWFRKYLQVGLGVVTYSEKG